MLAFLFLGFLLFVGWDQSYKSRYENFQGIAPTPEPVPVATSTPAPASAPVRSAATPGRVAAAPPRANPGIAATPPPTPQKDNSWMWGETKMDKPYKKK